MSVRLLASVALGLALAAPAAAQDPPKKGDPAEDILNILFTQELGFGPDVDVNESPLFEILQKLSKKHGLTFVINEESFKAAGVADIKERKPNVSVTQLRGLSMHQFLTTILNSTNATYLIKGSVIEIVTQSYAARTTKSAVTENEEGRQELAEPLVSVVLTEKPLNEAVALIAGRYDLNIVLSPQAGDARTGFVTARLLNVPADKAVGLLALQCDLRVVRKGNAFLITGRDQANEMFAEGLERQRQKIELEKLREAPPPKPQPEPAPEPKIVPPPEGVIILKGANGQGGLLQLKINPKPEK